MDEYPLKKIVIQRVDNGFTIKIDSEPYEKFEFVETTMEGALIILFKLQQEIQKRQESSQVKPKRK